MPRLRLVNLIDDLALGGVTRALAVFDSLAVARVAQCRTLAVAPGGMAAPRLDADVAVIHFTMNWRRIAFLAALRLRNPRLRIVLVEHSYTRAFEALLVPRPGRFRLMLRLAARMVHQVVAVSHGQAGWLEQAVGLPPRRITVIHPHIANPGLAALPAPTGANPLTVGAYGRFCLQKGFDDLLRATMAGALGDARLMLGGFGEDETLLRKIAADDPRIVFAGRVDDVAAFLGQCDVIAVPSRWEAYGMVANEAREAGRPILVAPVDGLPEQAGPTDDPAGLVVDFTDHTALGLAMAGLDHARLAAMSRAGRRVTADCGMRRAGQWADLIAGLS